MNKQLWGAWILTLGFSVGAWAQEVVEIPEEELARESVLPIFDTPEVVKNRNVPLSNRFEAGLLFGTNVNEAFYDQLLFGAQATYHFTEMSGVQVQFSMIDAKSSQYVPQLNRVGCVPVGGGCEALAYDKLPKPKYFWLVGYEFTPFYGKISITKQSVLNLTTYGLLGAGMFALGDTQIPLFSIGIGQNFFFGKTWGLKLDMKSLIYEGIDPVSIHVGDSKYNGEAPPVGDFKRQLTVNFTVSGGVIILL